METFKTKVEGYSKEFEFECFDNTEPIEIGDNFIFFFGGIADVQKCTSDTTKYEINQNNHEPKPDTIDLVTNFWRNCYKIKSTNFDLSKVY